MSYRGVFLRRLTTVPPEEIESKFEEFTFSRVQNGIESTFSMNYTKMAKRPRSCSAVILSVEADRTAVVEYDEKYYSWVVPDGIMVDRLMETDDYEIQITHTKENRALINIVCVRSLKTYLCQEINPLSKKDLEEWVVDE
jgi:hypothetical protein